MKARLAHLFVFAGAQVIFMVTTRGNNGGTFGSFFIRLSRSLCCYILLDLDYDVKLLSRRRLRRAGGRESRSSEGAATAFSSRCAYLFGLLFCRFRDIDSSAHF